MSWSTVSLILHANFEKFLVFKELYEMLVDELHKQIYVKSVSGVVKGFQRQGSQRQSGKKDKTSLVKQVLTGTATEDIQGKGPFRMVSVVAQIWSYVSYIYTAYLQVLLMFSITDSKLQSLMSVDLNEIAKPKPINEDININPEDNTVHFIAILLECLALLRRLPEAIDVRFL